MQPLSRPRRGCNPSPSIARGKQRHRAEFTEPSPCPLSTASVSPGGLSRQELLIGLCCSLPAREQQGSWRRREGPGHGQCCHRSSWAWPSAAPEKSQSGSPLALRRSRSSSFPPRRIGPATESLRKLRREAKLVSQPRRTVGCRIENQKLNSVCLVGPSSLLAQQAWV